MKWKVVRHEKIQTPEGELFMLYRDWDTENRLYDPKMVYCTTMAPQSSKGPMLHEQRSYHISAIGGYVDVEFLEPDTGELITVGLSHGPSAKDFSVLLLEPGIPVRLVNRSLTETAIVINCPSKAWHPTNPDTTKWSSWEEYREKSSK